MASLITLTPEDVVDTLVDEGSVVMVTGTDEDGQRVTIGADARAIDPALAALLMGEEPEVQVEFEPWQVLGRSDA